MDKKHEAIVFRIERLQLDLEKETNERKKEEIQNELDKLKGVLSR